MSCCIQWPGMIISASIFICLPRAEARRILKLMNREYTREWYMDRITCHQEHYPGLFCFDRYDNRFCTETDEDHKESLSLMEWAGYDFAYMFKYSERPGTKAAAELKDDVPEEVKSERLTEMIALQNKLSARSKKEDVGKTFMVLIEGSSKRSADYLNGRTSQNKVVVFPADGVKKGEYVRF